MRLVGRIVAGMIAISMGAAQAQQPVKEGDTLTGKLRLVQTSHPNGTKLTAYQIVSEPRMMPANDDFCDYDKGATTFHLFAMTDAAKKQLQPLLGKTVSVKAAKLFCSETAWHIGDVAVSEWTVLPK
jgi:hypothetical protein